MKKILLFSMLGVLTAGVVPGATIYQTDFESNPSANFTSVVTIPSDSEVNYAYDYSTWTPTAPTAGITSITLAPNSVAGATKGLKIRANFTQANGSGVNQGATAFLNPSTGLTSWVLTFDVFHMVNGPVPMTSGQGTTTGFVVGNAATTDSFYSGATALTGWFLLMTPEGGQGASGDARYYSGVSGVPTVNLATPNWAINGGTLLPTDMPGAAGTWDTIFTLPQYELAGAPGRRWVTWEITATGGNIIVNLTPVGGVKTQVAKWADTANRTLGLGFWDLNSGSVADPPADNFVVIDNLKLTTVPPPPSAAADWQIYN